MPTIVCDVCSRVDQVKFIPEDGSQVLCRACFKTVREDRERSIPSKAHGTRVSFPIKCIECGKEEVLSYIPKGHMENPLCTECATAHFGDRHGFRETTRKKERDLVKTHEAVCTQCGHIDYLPKAAPPDYWCQACDQGHEKAAPDVLKGTEELSRGLRVRRKKIE
jgi:hypothetical protein